MTHVTFSAVAVVARVAAAAAKVGKEKDTVVAAAAVTLEREAKGKDLAVAVKVANERAKAVKESHLKARVKVKEERVQARLLQAHPLQACLKAIVEVKEEDILLGQAHRQLPLLARRLQALPHLRLHSPHRFLRLTNQLSQKIHISQQQILAKIPA